MNVKDSYNIFKEMTFKTINYELGPTEQNIRIIYCYKFQFI